MSKRSLPQADIAARPGLRTEILPAALNRWNCDVHAKAEDAANTISILDVIGPDFFGDGVTVKRVSAALRSIGKEDVTILLNSPGGDYFEGLAIYNVLREHPAKVTVKVLGMAASAASVIAMAGDEIQIARAGWLMIHNTWVIAAGDRNVMRDVADWLEPFDRSAADIYAARTGMDAKDIGKMLDKETWVGGADAVEQGFADALLPSDEVTTKATNSKHVKAVSAMREIEANLAKAGVPVSRRKELVMAVKGGMRDAASTGTQDAAVIAGLSQVLRDIKQHRHQD